MLKDIKEAVLSCGHCVVGNNTSHQSQQILGQLSVAEPFDIIAIDFWIPGITTAKRLNKEDHLPKKAALTSLCNLTGFASVAYVGALETSTVADIIFGQFLIPNGLPKMILIDADSLFRQDLINMLSDMGIAHHIVSAEQHEGILCERFHRYLNKVQRIHGLDTMDFTQWMMNVFFAAYAWNSSPVDGTNIIRSFVAKARTFNFPLDVQESPMTIVGNPGERSLQHVETMFHLWFRKKELLTLLNEERRERHRKLADDGKRERIFQPGDLVVVRRQVQSEAAQGKPAKLMMRAKGPYRVLEQAGKGSYWIQRIPSLQTMTTRPGVRQKQASWRLERLPSTIVIHKRLNSSDTRWMERITPLRDNPLEQNLGLFDFGKYCKAPNNAPYAFDKMENLLDIQLDSGSEDEDDEEEDHKPMIYEDPEHQKGDQEDRTPPTKKRKVTFKSVKIINPQTTRTKLEKLAESIKASDNKLFVITIDTPGYKEKSWHIVQVEEEDLEWRKKRASGRYHVLFYVRRLTDSRNKKVKDCQYWPEIHEFKRDGVTMGPMVPTRPAKVAELLRKKAHRYMWYQDTIDLSECAVVGPFNFINDHHIPEEVWKELTEKAQQYNIYIGDINRVIPLDKPDNGRRNKNGRAYFFMEKRWTLDQSFGE